MKKFIISTHGFDFGIGGLKVLHKLCHLLNENGYDAYVVPVDFSQPFSVYDQYNVKMVTEDILNNLDDAIVVYPESWYGNYLNAPNVVRWMIGPPSKQHIDTWGESDLWFWYMSQYITKDYNKHSDNCLYIDEQHREVFYDQNLQRINTCWTLRKSQDFITKSDYVHPNDSVFIPYHAAGNLNELAFIFNKSSLFYCYDNYTYLPIQALMCGADAVVLPNKYTRQQFLDGPELNKYVAFGLNDLERARSLKLDFINHLDLIESKTINQLHTFAKKCYDHFG